MDVTELSSHVCQMCRASASDISHCISLKHYDNVYTERGDDNV
ncbi:unnamed protein product [Rhodiola kirilowii]